MARAATRSTSPPSVGRSAPSTSPPRCWNASGNTPKGRRRRPFTTERHDLVSTFPEGSFDLVTAQYLHTTFDFPREEVLRQAAHALATGGLLFIVDHGSTRPWAWNQDAEHAYPTPHDIYASLRLSRCHFRPERLDTPEREATGPNGETATVTDTVLAIRRIENQD